MCIYHFQRTATYVVGGRQLLCSSDTQKKETVTNSCSHGIVLTLGIYHYRIYENMKDFNIHI